MFDADRPITNSSQDLLGRSVFAKSLARSILDHKNPESLVVGLYGGWGTGKTSLINLVTEELQFAGSNMFDNERPIILNFSPWSYSGQEQLIFSFFRRLSSELRQSPYLEQSEEIIYLLELYVSFFTHKPVPKALRLQQRLSAYLFRRKRDTETLGWESGLDLTQVKKKLNELLIQQQHKIIISIDNIARLQKNEIKEMFQIVKSIGDFAQTVYILAIDKDYVVAALNETVSDSGQDYLEKIIQMPFTIPSFSHYELEKILLDKLQNLLIIVPKERWDKDYWADVYYSTLRYFFKDTRDITHYINTLAFSFEYVKEIVNPVDFFALTALEVFAPEVYRGVRDNKDLFTDLMDNVFIPDEKKMAEDKIRCDEILSRNHAVSRDQLIHLFVQLFPRLRLFYETVIPFYHSEAIARKNYRVCAPDLFDAYFRLSLSTGDFTEKEFNALISLVPDEEGFALALLRLNQDDRISKFLDLLDGLGIAQIPLQFTSHVMDALLDSSDLFPIGEKTAVHFNTPMRVHRILRQLLRRFDNDQKRFELFRKAINKATNSIYSLVHELTLQLEKHNEIEDTALPLEQEDFSPSQLATLKKLVVGKIIHWAELGRLIEHPQLIPILYAWLDWGDEKECKRYIALVTQDDRGLLSFLTAALKEPIDQALLKNEKDAHWQDYLINISSFIAPSFIEPHARQLFEDLEFEKLREREQLALLIFLDLIHAHTTKIIPKTS